MKYKVGQIYKCKFDQCKVKITETEGEHHYSWIYHTDIETGERDFNSVRVMDTCYELVPKAHKPQPTCKIELPELEPQEFNQKQAIAKIVIEE